ncbi:DUF805 domain-containing protein [Providencia manganoxydans]|uniref:DUF805 domain-containing protein n=1 Tax=Providencia manganoxydans TaxID=2923283 RepID=UPI0029280ADC
MSSFFNSYFNCFRNYFNFKDRSSRQEYIAFIIINPILLLIIERFTLIASIFYLIIFIPEITVSIRRLHDVNYSGWFLITPYLFFIIALPFTYIGGNLFGTIGLVIGMLGILSYLALAILMIFYKGDIGQNRFGNNKVIKKQ